MLLPDESPALSSCSTSTKSALLQIRFPPSIFVLQDGGMTVAITSLSNGTTIDSVHFRKGDKIANVSSCLPRTGCYGLVLVNTWKSYNYTIAFDGSQVNGDDVEEFPYYVTPHAVGNSSPHNSDGNMDDDEDDNILFTPYESNLTFLEFGDRSSCVPTCDPAKQDLYEVQTFAGNQGDGSFGWRLEQDEEEENPTRGSQARVLMGCGASEEAAGGGSSELCRGGGAYRVRITRACLPKSTSPGCRRFVIGHPNAVPAEPALGTPPGGPMNKTTMDMPGSAWVGHYHPMFKVSVNGAVVTNGTSTTFAAVEIGGNSCPSTSSSSPCPANESLLELFQYGTLRVDYVLQDLTSGRAVSHAGVKNSSASDAWTPLRYVRQCVSSNSGCYDLSISAATGAARVPHNNSGDDDDGDDDDGISTQAVLDGVYYTNALVRYVPFRVLLGDRCLRQQACPLAGEALIRIDINMSGLVPSQYVPSYYCAWSVFRANSDPPESVMPEESMSYFSNGYPGGSHVRHYMCVPDDGEQQQQGGPLTFGMLHSVPMEVEWSVARDGVPLVCRAALAGGGYESSTPTTTFDSTFSGYVVTPLDGSCPPNATTGPDSSPSPVLATGLFVGIVGGILSAVALMAAVVASSRSTMGATEASNVRGPGPWPSSLRSASSRRRRSIRSTGTESVSVTDDANSEVDECAREP